MYLQEYSFRLLREKSQIETLYVYLLLDEMAIKSQLVWDGNLNKFTGYIDIGIDSLGYKFILLVAIFMQKYRFIRYRYYY